MSGNSKRTVAALLTILVILLLVAGGWWVFRTNSPRSRDDMANAAAGKNAATAANMIHVGVIMSRYTAEADNSGNGPVGWERMARVCNELKAKDVELRPIVDPGTGQDQDVIQACRLYFGPAQPIDGGDDAALGELDAIVASHVTHLTQPQVDSIERAVRGGTGFLMRMFFCQYEPGFTPQVRGLLGFAAEGPIQYHSSHISKCVVVGEHPLLGHLSGTGASFAMSPNGFAGPYTGMPLIQLEGVEPPAALVYVAELGKGKIVGCPFAGAKPVPPELEDAAPGSFGTRAVRWLAEQHRAAKATTAPTTNPAP